MNDTELSVEPAWAEALDRIRHMNLVMGLALAQEGKLLHNLLPYGQERAEALARQIQETTHAHFQRCPHFDHLWFGFAQVQLLVTVLGSWQLIVLHQGLEPLDFLAGVSRLFLADHCHPNLGNGPNSNAFMGDGARQGNQKGPVAVTRIPSDRTNFRSRRMSEMENERERAVEPEPAPQAPPAAPPHLRPGFIRTVPPPIPPPPPPPLSVMSRLGGPVPAPDQAATTGLNAGWRPHSPQSVRPGAPLSPMQRAAESARPPAAGGEDLLSKETQRIPLPLLRRSNPMAPAAPPPATPAARWQSFRSQAVRMTASFSDPGEAEAKVTGLCRDQGIFPEVLPSRQQWQALLEALVQLAPSHIYADLMRRELGKLMGPGQKQSGKNEA